MMDKNKLEKQFQTDKKDDKPIKQKPAKETTTPKNYDRNVEQHKGRRCAICERDGTTIPHRMNNAERWIEVNDEEGFLCSACYFKSRDDDEPTTST